MRRLSLAAAVLLALGGAAQAMSYGGSSPSVMPGTTGFDHYATAQQLIKRREFASAIPHLEAALNQSPDDIGILSDLGYAHRMVAHASTGTAHDAEMRLSAAYYQRVLEQDLNDRDFLDYMGELYLSQDDVKSARDELKALDAVCPQGCPEHDHLAASLASYTPPAPVPVSTP